MTYFAGYTQTPEDAPPNGNGDGRKPSSGEETGRQDKGHYYDYSFLATGYACPNGGVSANPCGFPGYGSRYCGTYANYRLMRRHPRIAHARAQVYNAVKGADWGWEVREGTPDAQLELVRDMLGPQRAAVLDHALRSLDYGWAGWEKIWELRAGRWWIVENKPLTVDSNFLLVEKDTGKFAGIRYGVNDQWLDRRKCWLYTYDGEAGELYGQSRLENIRETAWRDWMDAATDLLRLGRKVSGIMPVLYTPPGERKMSDGTMKSWAATAIKTLEAAKEGYGIHLTHLGPANMSAGANNFDQLVNLIKASAVRLEVVNFGDQAPAIAGIIERMKHDEDLMFAGYLRSSRTGMEAEHGSKADAQEHTDTDTSDPELIAGDIADAFNRQVVDDVLAVNFGDDARGAVFAKPAKLRDEHKEMDGKILDAALQDESMRGQLLEQLDIDAIAERRGIPKKGKMIDVIDESDAQGDNADDGQAPEDQPQTQAA